MTPNTSRWSSTYNNGIFLMSVVPEVNIIIWTCKLLSDDTLNGVITFICILRYYKKIRISESFKTHKFEHLSILVITQNGLKQL